MKKETISWQKAGADRFLPITKEECSRRGWDAPDFVYAVGEAYVDHPSFGHAIISRVLEKAGYKVAMLCLPDWHTCDDFKRFGRPKLGYLVTAGVIDSMVNHYTAAKRRRNSDVYAPGGKSGMRPDRAVTVYCNRIHEAYPGLPILIGGVEASLRRFSHYDYWDDKVRRSVLVDSSATLLMYGMGEKSILECENDIERLNAETEELKKQEAASDAEISALREEDGNVYDIICGTFFLCSTPPDSENFESLTEEQMERYTKRFQRPEVFLRVNGEIMAVPV